MGKIGVMLYGYDRKKAMSIHDFLNELAGQEILTFSASERESDIVAMIIGQPSTGTFLDDDNKIVMFLGFPDDNIGQAMKLFPEGIQPPIFCALTEQNIHWTVEYLIGHLQEEKARLAK